uniref:Uncharacterized protein n=1 Tax=Plectus sambesii TaxID=2011161 RepID=A0A914WDA3_9BILA
MSSAANPMESAARGGPPTGTAPGKRRACCGIGGRETRDEGHRCGGTRVSANMIVIRIVVIIGVRRSSKQHRGRRGLGRRRRRIWVAVCLVNKRAAQPWAGRGGASTVRPEPSVQNALGSDVCRTYAHSPARSLSPSGPQPSAAKLTDQSPRPRFLRPVSQPAPLSVVASPADRSYLTSS